MNRAPSTPCPTPERLTAFAVGSLNRVGAAAVVAHLDECDDCVREVGMAMEALDDETPEEGTVHDETADGETADEEAGPAKPEGNVLRPRRWMPWLAAAAAAVLIVLLVPAVRSVWPRPGVGRLVALAPRTARVVEPRLTGGFGWSPYRGTDRSSDTQTDPTQMKLTGAAGELIERAQHDEGAQAQHDAGVALVLTRNAAEALPRLERAAAAQPSVKTWSDLAAARYAVASDLGRAALYPQALAAADAALRLEPDLAEALFNRALILERMGLLDEARAAWTRYLAVDPSSQWAGEARVHLAELPAAKQSSDFERIRPQLEAAAARGDSASLRALLAQHAARARAFAEAETLGRWAEGVLQHHDAEAERSLAVARAIGSALAADANETLLRDAVQAIDAASPPDRERLARAHAAYRSGRIAFSRQDLDAATSDLGRAATLFTEARSPMELAARFYLASVRQVKTAGGAAADLQRCLAAANAHPTYRALGATIRWELGRARMFDYDWPGAAAILAEGAAAFREARDQSSEAFVEAMLAYCLAAEGRGDDAWSSHIRAFRALSAEGNRTRLASAVSGAMRSELVAGRGEAALALAQLPRRIDGGDTAQRQLLLDALQYESMLESTLGRSSDALATAREAGALARELPDSSVRARWAANVDVLTGAAMASSDPSSAIAALTPAIDFYRRAGLARDLPEALLLRARCALRRAAADAAARDLEEGMSIVERHRERTAGAAGTGILNADQALFAEALRLHLDRGEDAAAFAIAERSRGATMTVAGLQARLAGSATAVLEIVVLPDSVVSFAVTANDFRVGRRDAGRATLATLADRSLSESGTAAAAALYEAIIRPVDIVVPRVRNVIVVPDPLLQRVPFAALFDATAGTRLVERAGVAIASSAASLQRDAGHASASVALIALPSGGATGMAALPQAERELTDIAALYRSATTIPPADATLGALDEALADADVVHVAGHTERQPAGGEYALLFAGREGAELERTTSRSLATHPLARARLLVLAACETLRPPASNDTRALSLGAAFAAAGVRDVVGTLTAVGDRDARTFFRLLHQHLAGGAGAAAALRAAQMDALRQQRDTSGSQAWRSVALLTACIDAHQEARR